MPIISQASGGCAYPLFHGGGTPPGRPICTIQAPEPAPARGAETRSGSGTLVQDLIDQTIGLRVVAGHEVVAVGVARDALDRLTRMVREQLVQALLQVQDFPRLDFDVRRLAARAAERLVNHHARVRQREALALLAGCQQERAHAGREAHAKGRNVRLDELHRVVDRHAGRHRTARAVDVQADVLVRIFAFEKQQLGDHEIGRLVVHFTDQEHHALLQQTRVDVVRTLAAAARLHDDRHEPERLRIEIPRSLGGQRVQRLSAKSHAVHPCLKESYSGMATDPA
ncbi:Prolipoprotein diacylglyceryltransferase [Paraburkholderia tropica]